MVLAAEAGALASCIEVVAVTDKVRAGVVQSMGNSADFLHDALRKLREAHKANVKQRNALCGIFGLGDTADNVTFYGMLAEFNGLPGVVRENLSQSTAASRFFEWVGPIESAIRKLDGRKDANLNQFMETPQFVESLAQLYVCAQMMPEADRINLDELDNIGKVIDEALSAVQNAELNEELTDWLVTRLHEVKDVIAAARAFGVHAARKQMKTLVGDVFVKPCPPTESKAGGQLISKVGDIFDRVGTAVFADMVKNALQRLLGQ